MGKYHCFSEIFRKPTNSNKAACDIFFNSLNRLSSNGLSPELIYRFSIAS